MQDSQLGPCGVCYKGSRTCCNTLTNKVGRVYSQQGGSVVGLDGLCFVGKENVTAAHVQKRS